MQCPRTEESSSLESFALDLGDCIGAESCVDLKSDLSDLEGFVLYGHQSNSREGLGRMKRGNKEKEYPPPIPWLARTGNLPSHMPWVMKRYHTSDGRLIIREEKVKRHEYFQAHRSGGRLTLRLVPLTDDVSDDHHVDDDEAKYNFHADEDGEVDGFIDVAAEVMAEIQTEDEESIMNLSESSMEKCGGNGSGGGGGGGGGGECHKIVRSSCMFGMTLPSFRPVRT